MPNLAVHHVIEPAVGAAVGRLIDAVERSTGQSPLSDHLAVDLAHGGGDGFVAITATDDATGDVVAYAQASAANESYALELVVDPSRSDDGTGPALVRAAIAEIADLGGRHVNWLVRNPTRSDEDVAAELGLAPTRTLLQMRRSLPTGIEVTIATRSIVVGADDQDFLDVNNLAFAGHGEQGGWTIETLRRRQAEPWFDPDDVRVHEHDGRIAAFCWTKIHPATGPEPELGEIYVVAVHPDHRGRGLGREMTLAGLEHLSGRGIGTGMLWVDGDNSVALGLYDRLGFAVVATTVAYSTP